MGCLPSSSTTLLHRVVNSIDTARLEALRPSVDTVWYVVSTRAISSRSEGSLRRDFPWCKRSGSLPGNTCLRLVSLGTMMTGECLLFEFVFPCTQHYTIGTVSLASAHSLRHGCTGEPHKLAARLPMSDRKTSRPKHRLLTRGHPTQDFVRLMLSVRSLLGSFRDPWDRR